MKRPCALALVALASCTELYDPCMPLPGIVQDLRVLAVTVDPPEAAMDPATGEVQQVTARLLVADPSGADSLPVSMTACAADAAGNCVASFTLRESAPLSLAASVPLRVPPDLIAAAAAADPLQGFGGVQVRLDIVILPPGAAPVTARKTLVFRRPDAQDPPNHGLVLTGLRVRRISRAYNSNPVAYPPWPDEEVIEPDGILHFDVYDKGWLRPLIAPGPGAIEAAEEYQTTDFSGARVTVRETVSYAFYSSFGDISGPRTAVIDPVAYFEPENTAVEPFPDVDVPGLVGMNTRRASAGVLWVVARDSRGAEAWATFPWVARDATLKDVDTGLSTAFVFDQGPRCAKNE